jgi:broad specificity phosphatase PhoE
MTFARLLALPILALAFAAPAAARDIYVMRHLEKEAGQDPGLSEEGRHRAERLADWFGRNPPAAIYVSATRRARETAAPLAAKLHIVPKDYAPGDVAGVAAQAKAERGNVLIVGHSNTVPEIVAALGGAKPEPIPDDRFGDIWRVSGNPPRTERKSLGGN